jgi:putative ubiquitin-RnfH superfamily antitoxin RatB of RatAB toxin-antitoxin module
MSQSLINVEVVYAPAPGQIDISHLKLRPGSTVADALKASGLLQRHPQAAGLTAGVWGRKQPADAGLRAGDRVEVYRPLRCDPKEARRQRYRQRADKVATASQSGATAGSGTRLKPAT